MLVWHPFFFPKIAAADKDETVIMAASKYGIDRDAGR